MLRGKGRQKGNNLAANMGLLLVVALIGRSSLNSYGFDSRGDSFLSFKDLSGFRRTLSISNEMIYTSGILKSASRWNELVPSWNVEGPLDNEVIIEVAPLLSPGQVAKYYCLGKWSAADKKFRRESVSGQSDDLGEVSTDTLKLNTLCDRFRARVTFVGTHPEDSRLKFLSFSVANTRLKPRVLPPNKKAWGKVLPVPERSQMAYPNGNVLCSPTTVSMLTSFWSVKLNRPDLEHDVPDVVRGVYDEEWQAAGNWPFNMAYVGSYPGMRAYVSRFSDVSELEDWIASGIPVGLSLCYNRLRGRDDRPPSGHLIVCVGFTEKGDVIVNDPGTSKNIRKTFPRKNLINAWAYSKNAVYITYPLDAKIPHDRFGHWDSQRANDVWQIKK